MAENVPQNPQFDQLNDRLSEVEGKMRETLERTSELKWSFKNWEAVKTTLEIQEQRFNEFQVQIDACKNLIMTLQNQFTQFQQQRAIELQHFVNHGPTASYENKED